MVPVLVLAEMEKRLVVVRVMMLVLDPELVSVLVLLVLTFVYL